MKKRTALLFVVLILTLALALCACGGGGKSLSGTEWELSAAVMGGEEYTAEDFVSLLGECSFSFTDDSNVTMIFLGSTVACTYAPGDGVISLTSEESTEELAYDGETIVIDLGDGDSMTFVKK